ncbi:hypothetical protein CTI14_41670, partial [Methylobacterium radiotolerans]
YQSPSFKECVARLQYIAKTRSFGLVTGEIGAGKSTAIRALRDGLDQTKYRFMYLCDSSQEYMEQQKRKLQKGLHHLLEEEMSS